MSVGTGTFGYKAGALPISRFYSDSPRDFVTFTNFLQSKEIVVNFTEPRRESDGKRPETAEEHRK
jgi:hypothetical protein